MAERTLRLDQWMAANGLAESRSAAQRLIMAGEVLVGGQPVFQPSTRVKPGTSVVLRAPARYVSRGGEKLEAALDQFGVRPGGWTCADVGASTGGFTDCLLQRGASRVYAIDVGHGQLHARLRADPRVVVMERTNARHLAGLPEPVRLVTADVSFISLRHILPRIAGWLGAGGEAVVLIKPQFEAGPNRVGKGGVVLDPATHREVLTSVLAAAMDVGLAPAGLIASPLLGPKGNREFLAWLRKGGVAEDPATLVRGVV